MGLFFFEKYIYKSTLFEKVFCISRSSRVIFVRKLYREQRTGQESTSPHPRSSPRAPRSRASAFAKASADRPVEVGPPGHPTKRGCVKSYFKSKDYNIFNNSLAFLVRVNSSRMAVIKIDRTKVRCISIGLLLISDVFLNYILSNTANCFSKIAFCPKILSPQKFF